MPCYVDLNYAQEEVLSWDRNPWEYAEVMSKYIYIEKIS